jgi:hypothetical protein
MALGVTVGAGTMGCGGSLEPELEFRVEGTVTGATSTAGAYAVVVGELYEGACGSGTLLQRSQVRAGNDGRFSVGFGIEFNGCIRLAATSTSAAGVTERSGVRAGGSGAKTVQMDVALGTL